MGKPSTIHPYGKVEGNRSGTYQGGWSMLATNVTKTITTATSITLWTVPANAQVFGIEYIHLKALTKDGSVTSFNLQFAGASATTSADIFIDQIGTVTAGVTKNTVSFAKNTKTSATALVLRGHPAGGNLTSGKVRVQIHYIKMNGDLKKDPVVDR